MYADVVTLLGKNMIATKKNKDSILFSIGYVGPKVKAEKNKYVCI